MKMPSANGWDTWANHVLCELERMAGAVAEWRSDNAAIHSELSEIKALLSVVCADADTALTKSQKNEVKLERLAVQTGLVAALVSLLGTGLGALFVYAASRMGP